MIADDETLDPILRGKARILQKKSGYRFSMDALLLSHFAQVQKKARVMDLGTGVGIIAILIAKKDPTAIVTGIEIQRELCDCAKKNVVLNDLTDRVRIFQLAVQEASGVFPAQSFDLVIANPPYRKMNSGRPNPDQQKMQARHEVLGKLEDFLGASSHLLGRGGRADFIVRAARLSECVTLMSRLELEPRRLRLVHPTAEKDAHLALVEGVKQGRSELTVLPPLCIHRSDGLYADEVAGILEGACL